MKKLLIILAFNLFLSGIISGTFQAANPDTSMTFTFNPTDTSDLTSHFKPRRQSLTKTIFRRDCTFSQILLRDAQTFNYFTFSTCRFIENTQTNSSSMSN